MGRGALLALVVVARGAAIDDLRIGDVLPLSSQLLLIIVIITTIIVTSISSIVTIVVTSIIEAM